MSWSLGTNISRTGDKYLYMKVGGQTFLHGGWGDIPFLLETVVAVNFPVSKTNMPVIKPRKLSTLVTILGL